MPKTIIRINPYCNLLYLINGRAKTNGYTRVALAIMIGRTEPTIINRMQHPERFTVEELTRIGIGLHIPIEEIRACIHY